MIRKLARSNKYDHRRLRELSREYLTYIGETHCVFLESVIGFKLIHDTVTAKQGKTASSFMGTDFDYDLIKDNCGILYKEICGIDLQPLIQSVVPKQGEVTSRNREGGSNTRLLINHTIVSLYSMWESYFRPELAKAFGFLEKGARIDEEVKKVMNRSMKDDLWGDIRLVRQDIIHHKSITSEDSFAKYKIIKQIFRVGDVIDIPYQVMRAIFLELVHFGNLINSLSYKPRTITIPRSSENG